MASASALHRHLEILAHGVPVDDVPPGFDVIWPDVLVLQVIGMFPDVDADYRGLAGRYRAVLVGQGFENEFLVPIDAEPGPTAAEVCDGRLGEGFFEIAEAAKSRRDGLG